MNAQVRTFESGATRNLDDTKPDFEGFLSPLVLRRYGEYMHKHRFLPDGSMRASDNWQAGIPLDVYAKSAFRHFLDFHAGHRGYETAQDLEDDICALIFNLSGYLHERLKAGRPRTAYVIDADRLSKVDVAALFDSTPGAIVRVNEADTLRVQSFGGIHAHVPPFVAADSDEEMGLKAGEAISPGGTD